MEGVQSEIIGEAASCSVVVGLQTSKSGIWCGDSTIQTTDEDLISVSRNSDPVMTIELGLEEMVVTSCELVLHKWVV